MSETALPRAGAWYEMRRCYYVYMMASRSRVIYTGMTNDLERRVCEHKEKRMPGFTSRYNITRLVHFEAYYRPQDAIHREKQIKGWLRAKKKALIESTNPAWEDVTRDWLRGLELYVGPQNYGWT